MELICAGLNGQVDETADSDDVVIGPVKYWWGT